METPDYTQLGLIAPPHRNRIPAGPQIIGDILDAGVKQAPDRIALSSADESYSYTALKDAMDAACHFLQEKGIGPGDRVAASMRNRCDIVIAFLAVQKIGAVWVGINAILPADDKAFILSHSGTKLLLADNEAARQVEAHHTSIQSPLMIERVEKDCAWREAISRPAPPLDVEAVDPFAPATIMYTSGTTGTPKGVVHSQHNMLVVCAAFSSAGLLSPAARRGVVLPLTITNVMVLGPLMAFWNARTCVCGSTAKTRPMVEWIHAENIQTFSAVPTMVYDILQADLDLPDDLQLGAGGAPLPDPVRQAFAKRHKRNLGQSYGLTEAPTVVTESRGLDAPENSSGLAPSHLEVTIRDKQGNRLPAEKVGEICIAAASSGDWANIYTPPLGYWRDLEKSETLLAGGVVHTGDYGHFDENGWLFVADRGSELILRGGSNVYPAEIERVLYMSDQVADCSVVGKPDARMGHKTVAFVQPVPDTDPQVLEQSLKDLCKEKLVKYKIPDEWRFVDEFPRNAMGKILKPRLRDQIAAEIEA